MPNDKTQENLSTIPPEIPAPPQIISEEDAPFPTSGSEGSVGYGQPAQENLSDSDSLDEAITKFKYVTGRRVLWVSMGVMGVAVGVSIFLSVFHIENTLVENAFEVFKLIAMTVLGYIFGSKSK